MKRMKWILLVVLTVSTISGYSQVASRDEMIKKVFSVHQNKDEEGYIKLFPDVATLKAFMNKLFDRDTTGEMKKMMQVLFDDLTDSTMQAKLRKEFKANIKKAEQKGIVWKDAVFASYKSDSTADQDEGMGASKLNGKIYFTHNTKEYFLEFDDIILFDKGWYGVGVGRIDERAKENDIAAWDGEDLSDPINAVDSVMMVDTTVAVEQPKKPVQKSKQPVKQQPKARTQTPAKKPE